jgi:hypothetical protein
VRLARGLAGGVAAAGALVAFDRLEAAWLGRPAVYAPTRIAGGLADRWLGVVLGDRDRRVAGALLRAGYGAALGVAAAALPLSPRVRPWAFGLAVALAERFLLPAARATPPASRWSAAERWLLVPHAVAFAWACEAALAAERRWTAPRPAARGIDASGRRDQLR